MLHLKLTGAPTLLPSLAGQFNVHVRGPGVVALQNRKQPRLYLCIKEGTLTHGDGDSTCNFNVIDNGGCMCEQMYVHS